MLPLGAEAPDFSPSQHGWFHGLACRLRGRRGSAGDVHLQPLSVRQAHCRGIGQALAAITRDRGVAIVGINSNDVENYADDSPEKMRQEAEQRGYTFPYLYDETQEVAKAYRAACTPDFFLFDRARCLVYRGQLDSSRPGSGIPVTGEDLRAALDAVLAGEAVREEQRGQYWL